METLRYVELKFFLVSDILKFDSNGSLTLALSFADVKLIMKYVSVLLANKLHPIMTLGGFSFDAKREVESTRKRVIVIPKQSNVLSLKTCV